MANGLSNSLYGDYPFMGIMRIVGYGDYRQGPPSEAEMGQLIDRSPFDFMHNDFHMAIGGALWDLMGKHLEVPAYKLLGR